MTPEERIKELQREWARKKSDLADTIVSGPFIEPSDSSGVLATGIRYAGFKVVLSADNKKMAAEIVADDRRWESNFRNLFLFEDEIIFPIMHVKHDRRDFSNLVSLPFALDEVYNHATRLPNDIISLLESMTPMLALRYGWAHLKNGAEFFVNPLLSSAGFAASPMQVSKIALSVKLVWAFPSLRKAGKIKYYLAAGTIIIPRVHGGGLNFDDTRWGGVTREPFCGALRNKAASLCQKPCDVLSDAGRKRAIDVLDWNRGEKKSLRAEQHEARVSFVKQNRDLWYNHEGLADALIKAGLYSTKYNLMNIVDSCAWLVKLADAQEAPDGIDFQI